MVARAVEAAGISTCCLSLAREMTVKVRPPRALSVKWPFGSPVGEPHAEAQQLRILRDMLEVVRGATVPGTLIDLPYRWRREDYGQVVGLKLE